MKKYVDYCQKLKEGKGFGSQFLAGGGGGVGGGNCGFAVSENQCMQYNPMVLMQERVVSFVFCRTTNVRRMTLTFSD